MDSVLTLQECLDMKEKGQGAIIHNGAVTGFEKENIPTQPTKAQ